MDIKYTLDTRGLNCPIPVAKVKKNMLHMQLDELLLVISDDPVSVIDIPAYAKISKNELVKNWKEEKDFYFVLKKSN